MNMENTKIEATEQEMERFKSWLEQFLLSEKSLKDYIWAVRKMLKECKVINEAEINKFIKKHQNTLFISAVKKYLEFKGLKFKLIKIKQKRKIRVRPPEIEEIKNVMEEIREKDKDLYWILRIGLLTGARIHEILSLRLNDIDFEENRIIFRKTKTGHEHEVFMVEHIMNELRNYLIEEKGVLGAQRCLFTDYKNIETAYRIYRKKIKKYIKNKELARKLMQSHNIRRAVINWILKSTGNIVYAKEFVGHASISTTERYLSELTREEAKKKVSEKISEVVL